MESRSINLTTTTSAFARCVSPTNACSFIVLRLIIIRRLCLPFMWLHHLRCCFTNRNSSRDNRAKERRRESSAARNPSPNLGQSRTPKERNHHATKTGFTSLSGDRPTRGRNNHSRYHSRRKATAAAPAASGGRGELVVPRAESPTVTPTWQTQEEHYRIAHPSGSQSCSVARSRRVEGSFDSPCNLTGQRYFSRWVIPVRLHGGMDGETGSGRRRLLTTAGVGLSFVICYVTLLSKGNYFILIRSTFLKPKKGTKFCHFSRVLLA